MPAISAAVPLYSRNSNSGVGGYGERGRGWQQLATYPTKSWQMDREILSYNLQAIKYFVSVLFFMSEEVKEFAPVLLLYRYYEPVRL